MAPKRERCRRKAGRASSLPRDVWRFRTKPSCQKPAQVGVRHETPLGRQDALPYFAAAASRRAGNCMVPSKRVIADACLVRMAEQERDTAVVTLDPDFRIYRRHGRQTIPLIVPE